MRFTKEFRDAMLIGHEFWEEYENDERTENWAGSEECSTFARIILDYAKANKFTPSYAYSLLKEQTIDDINDGKAKVEDHMWDYICKGFLAGEILGYPTEENLKKVKQAEKLWKDETYGYYQEVLNEVV